MTALLGLSILLGVTPSAAAYTEPFGNSCGTSTAIQDITALSAGTTLCTVEGTVVANITATSPARNAGEDFSYVLADDTSSSSYSGEAIAGRGATFAGPVQESLTTGWNAETGAGKASYGVCGSSCGKRALFGEMSSSDRTTLNTTSRVVGDNEPKDAGETDGCSSASGSTTANIDDTVMCLTYGAYAASDSPLTAAEYAKAKTFAGDDSGNGRVLTIPYAVGEVTASYRIDGFTDTLQLNGALIEAIYFGDIDTWGDAAIVALNPGLAGSTLQAKGVHRCDGSGTTFAFTDYLNRATTGSRFTAHDQFTVGNVCVPLGSESCTKFGGATGSGAVFQLDADTLCGNGNQRVAEVIDDNNGAIGYVELQTALDQGLAYADLQNAAGEFVTPDSASGAAAAAGRSTPQAWEVWTGFSIAYPDASSPDAYPASTFTYMMVWANPSSIDNPATASTATDQYSDFWSCTEYGALQGFLEWVLTTGQGTPLSDNSLSPLDATTQAKMRDAVDRFMNCGTTSNIVVRIADVGLQGYPLVGHEVIVDGTRSAVSDRIVDSDHFGVSGPDTAFGYPTVPAATLAANNGQYVRIQGLLVLNEDLGGLVPPPVTTPEGTDLLLVAVGGGSLVGLVRAYVPDDHTWVTVPQIASVVNTLDGQVISGVLIVRNLT